MPSRDAEHKAVRLLESRLDPDQLRTFRNYRWFEVRGKSGRLYRINCTYAGASVQEVGSDGRATMNYCYYLKGYHSYPAADNWLMQAMLIAANEKRMRQVAMYPDKVDRRDVFAVVCVLVFLAAIGGLIYALVTLI